LSKADDINFYIFAIFCSEDRT